MKLQNLNPNIVEKELFLNHSMYLYKVFREDTDPNIKRYIEVNDVSLVIDRFKESGDWPEYLVLHEHNINKSKMITVDLLNKKVTLSQSNDKELIEIISKYDLFANF